VKIVGCQQSAFGLILTVMIFAFCSFVQAQEPAKVFRLEYLSSFDASTESARFEAIRLALREMGYVEGQNIAIEYRYAEGDGRAAELVRLKVDIILVAVGGEPIQAAKNATKTIPIVMVGVGAIQSRESG